MLLRRYGAITITIPTSFHFLIICKKGTNHCFKESFETICREKKLSKEGVLALNTDVRIFNKMFHLIQEHCPKDIPAADYHWVVITLQQNWEVIKSSSLPTACIGENPPTALAKTVQVIVSTLQGFYAGIKSDGKDVVPEPSNSLQIIDSSIALPSLLKPGKVYDGVLQLVAQGYRYFDAFQVFTTS